MILVIANPRQKLRSRIRISSCWVTIRLHTENQLYTLPGSALKVCVVGGGWVGGVESEFSDQLWLWPSRTIDIGCPEGLAYLFFLTILSNHSVEAQYIIERNDFKADEYIKRVFEISLYYNWYYLHYWMVILFVKFKLFKKIKTFHFPFIWPTRKRQT